MPKTTTVAELGEFALIERVSRTMKQTLPSGYVGIGDDCALIPQSAGRSLLVTTDLLVEGIHFLIQNISADDLGHKALAVNLSDIAAMGGTPTEAFVSLALPASTPVEWLDLFFKGLGSLAHRFEVKILGGDTTGSQNGITINVTVLGDIQTAHAKLRSAAVCGDLICVVGQLGDAAAGLKLYLEHRDDHSREAAALKRAHDRPEPLIEQGRWLAEQAGVHAMMDISDGLASDVPQILKSSGVGAKIHLETLPISPELQTCARLHGWNVTEIAARGGEDYGLLVTIDALAYAQVSAEFSKRFGPSLCAIGEVSQPDDQLANELIYKFNGQPWGRQIPAYRHFAGG